jgi:dUTP pyrophosphatase
MINVQIKRLNSDVSLPQYKHHGDAGMDLCNASEDITIEPSGRTLIPTGLKVGIPLGFELQIRPRSGLSLKKGLTVLNTPGTIDAGYRGEIGVIIFNTNPNSSVIIKKGERIAQAVLNKVEQINWQECEELDETSRNEGGFGSTGH